jgi:hypothetical protein
VCYLKIALGSGPGFLITLLESGNPAGFNTRFRVRPLSHRPRPCLCCGVQLLVGRPWGLWETASGLGVQSWARALGGPCSETGTGRKDNSTAEAGVGSL